MQKIMFNDKYGLTNAVLEGRKTQTRRIVGLEVFSRTSLIKKIINRIFKKDGGDYSFECDGKTYKLPKNKCPKYKVGEIVAVSQSYKYIFDNFQSERVYAEATQKIWKEHPEFIPEKVFRNKMFVKAEYMPHQIKITNVRLERLQDISDEDCSAEGIMEGDFMDTWNRYYFDSGETCNHNVYSTARNAYAALIDKISGKGTWDSNPYVWVYEFELVR